MNVARQRRLRHPVSAPVQPPPEFLLAGDVLVADQVANGGMTGQFRHQHKYTVLCILIQHYCDAYRCALDSTYFGIRRRRSWRRPRPSTARRQSLRARRECVLLQEFPSHYRRVLLLAVDRVVHLAHVVGRDASGKTVEGRARRGASAEEFRPHDRHGVVRRKVVAVIVEHNQSERGDQAVGVRSGDDIDRPVLQARDRAGPGPSPAALRRISGRRSAPAPGSRPAARETRIPHPASCAEPRGASCDNLVRPRRRASSPRITMAKLLLKPRGGITSRPNFCRYWRFTSSYTCARIARRLLLQHGRQRRTGVFGIDIDAAGENGLLADVGAGEIETAVDRRAAGLLAAFARTTRPGSVAR